MSNLILFWSMACIPQQTEHNDTNTPSCWQNVENTWESTHPPNELEGTGFELGETPPDMCMTDQFGSTVSLWQFYGNVILLDVSSEWSGPSQEMAPEVDGIWTDYREDDFIYLTLLAEDLVSDTPSVETLAQWADNFSITSPVLSDSERYRERLTPTGVYPKLLLIHRNMTVRNDNLSPVNSEVVRAAIEEAL